MALPTTFLHHTLSLLSTTEYDAMDDALDMTECFQAQLVGFWLRFGKEGKTVRVEKGVTNILPR